MRRFCSTTNKHAELIKKFDQLIRNARQEIEDKHNPLFKFQNPPQTEEEKLKVMKEVDQRLKSQLKFLSGSENFKIYKEA